MFALRLVDCAGYAGDKKKNAEIYLVCWVKRSIVGEARWGTITGIQNATLRNRNSRATWKDCIND